MPRNALAAFAILMFMVSLAGAYTSATAYYIEDSGDSNYSNTDVLSCPSYDELYSETAECEQEGKSYTKYYDDSGCLQVKCVERADRNNTCPSDSELSESARECASEGYEYYKYYDSSGCVQVSCRKPTASTISWNTTHATTTSSCPSWDTLETEMERCRAAGLGYGKYSDDYGCTYVKCTESSDEVDCKKTVNAEGCVKISCDDGYYYNSCSATEACRSECKTYENDEGCKVTECSNGYTFRVCSSEETRVRCDVKEENGCRIKNCTNGYYYSSCELERKCEDYTNERGCEVVKCTDGYTAEKCASDSNETEEVECKSYEENSCKVKVCTNGYVEKECEAEPEEEDNKTAEVPLEAGPASNEIFFTNPVATLIEWLSTLFGSQ